MLIGTYVMHERPPLESELNVMKTSQVIVRHFVIMNQEVCERDVSRQFSLPDFQHVLSLPQRFEIEVRRRVHHWLVRVPLQKCFEVLLP